MTGLQELQKVFDIQIKNEDVFLQALTHSSAYNEHLGSPLGSYQRLEFLGDSLLNTHISIYLFECFPKASEGQLSYMRSHLVSSLALYQWAKQLNLFDFIYVGKSQIMNAQNHSQEILADVMEALLAAIFLDSGMEKLNSIIRAYFQQHQKELSFIGEQDYKSWVQDYFQKYFKCKPEYHYQLDSTIFEKPLYVAQLRIPGENKKFQAQSHSKKKASLLLAQHLYHYLNKDSS